MYMYMHISYVYHAANESTDNEVRPSEEVAGGKEPTQLIHTLGREEEGHTTKKKGEFLMQRREKD